MYHHNSPPLPPSPPPSPPQPCSQGHSGTHTLTTTQGGAMCLLCFSHLLSNPNSPTFHVSYALSQLTNAVTQPIFLRHLLSFHIHLLLSPLISSLSSFTDDRISASVTELICLFCESGDGLSLAAEFVSHLADRLSASNLSLSRRQLYSLHCLGLLLTRHPDTYPCVKDKATLIYNLVVGLQLPSEEIRGEIMFVLYKICILELSNDDKEGVEVLLNNCSTLLYLCLDALLKTQRDDVRLNCIALLEVLGQRGMLSDAFSSDFNKMDIYEADDNMHFTDDDGICLIRLFAEAVKSPLLSLDIQVQISTLDFIFHCLSRGDCSVKQIEIMVQENVADFVFEILRLSEQKDQVITSCLQVLDLLSTAEEAFKHRLAIGFTTLVSILPRIAQVPFHPIQTQILKLILNSISNFPGILSTNLIDEISSILAPMLNSSIISETLITICTILAALMKCPSASGSSTLISMIKEASRNAILTSLSLYNQDQNQLLHSLYLLKEAYRLSTDSQLGNMVLEVCQKHILPWFVTSVDEMDEETIMGILETLHFVLERGPNTQAYELANALLSHSWFHVSFTCLGLHPTQKMKVRVYLLLSSIVDCILGEDSGLSIRVAASALPADPIDLLFLIGQRSANNSELSSYQAAALQILYVSSLYNEMLADKKLVLTSLEQYILTNSSHLLYGATGSIIIKQILNLYSLFRDFTYTSYQIPINSEAERIFFHLITEQDWDISSFDFHPLALKWLFQQERISKTLSHQILKLCRKSYSNGINNNLIHDVAQLVSTGDNLLPELLVSLLNRLIGDEMEVEETILLIHFLSLIIHICPDASYQLCMNGIGKAIENLCSNLIYSSVDSYKSVSRFIFIVLSSMHAQPLPDDEAWLAVIMKLVGSFTKIANGWTEENLLVIAILSLVLHYSTKGALIEASKFIIVNNSLPSITRATIDELYTNGYYLSEQDEGTNTEQTLLFLLLLHHFYLRSLQAVIPGLIDWRNFLILPQEPFPQHSMGVYCEDICRLLHFGSPLVKLIASYSLVELLTKITYQLNTQQQNLKCTMGFLRSIVALLEGLALDCDQRIAMNSSLCLSLIFTWQIPDVRCLVKNNGWCRMIVEELAVCLGAPSSVLKSSIYHHKPTMHIATALLRTNQGREWIKSVFDEACVGGIAEKMSLNDVDIEVVCLCRELLRSGFLKPEQIVSLNHLLQACARHLCMEERSEAESMEEQTRQTITMEGNLGEVSEFLLRLMSLESHAHTSSSSIHVKNGQLAKEINLYFRLLEENEEF